MTLPVVVTGLGPLFYDSVFRVIDNGDTTKRLALEVDGFTTGTTRTWTALDANIVVAGSASALTTGRVTRATSGGLLIDGTDLTMASSALTVGDATAAASITIAGLGSANRSLIFADPSGVTRWAFRVDSSTLFNLRAVDAANTLIDIPLTIANAAGGNITIVRPLTTSGNLTQTGAATVSTGTGDVSLNGNVLVPLAKQFAIGTGVSSIGMVAVNAANTALTGTTQSAFQTTMQSNTAGTARTIGYNSQANTSAAAYTTALLIQFSAYQTLTAGAGSTIDRSVDFYGRERTIGTNNAVFYIGNATTASFTGNWGIYHSGSVGNYLGTGATLINTTTDDAVHKLQVSGRTRETGRSPGVTSTATAASNTTLTISSTEVQSWTGSTAGKTITFPAANAAGAGFAVMFCINNQSSVTVTPTRAGSDTFQGGGTTDAVLAGATQWYASDGVSVWLKV